MKCPVCTNVDLLMSERLGVEIDYCPNCRGVWLDRGELDKIIEREQGASGRYQGEPPRHVPPQPQYVQGHDQPYRPEHHSKHDDHHEDKGHGYGHGQRKKKSFFEELFD